MCRALFLIAPRQFARVSRDLFRITPKTRSQVRLYRLTHDEPREGGGGYIDWFTHLISPVPGPRVASGHRVQEIRGVIDDNDDDDDSPGTAVVFLRMSRPVTTYLEEDDRDICSRSVPRARSDSPNFDKVTANVPRDVIYERNVREKRNNVFMRGQRMPHWMREKERRARERKHARETTHLNDRASSTN